jgi:Spy/CpxP family protein refolding chaperone
MTNTIKALAAALALGAACVLGGTAQDQPAPKETGTAFGSRIRENIITFKLLRMTQALSLTQEQTAVIYPALTRLEKEKYELTHKLNESMERLRGLLVLDKPDEDKLPGLMAEIGSLRDRISNTDAEEASFLKTRLSVVQNARYLLFNVEFYRGLGERLERARRLHLKNRFTR